jgi:DNA-binding transcriptional regulator YdaS (Cro superfamily)
MRDSALSEAIRGAGGPAALGREIGVSSQAISQWERCPAERVLQVESASGVSRHRLRPDLYPIDDRRRATGTEGG